MISQRKKWFVFFTCGDLSRVVTKQSEEQWDTVTHSWNRNLIRYRERDLKQRDAPYKVTFRYPTKDSHSYCTWTTGRVSESMGVSS